jgi:acyl-CoA synthetase (AMP-forming)/AMP-acid ligase II
MQMIRIGPSEDTVRTSPPDSWSRASVTVDILSTIVDIDVDVVSLPRPHCGYCSARGRLCESQSNRNDQMAVVLTVPTPADLAASYRAGGFWDDSGLRAGLETIAEADPRRLAIADHSESVSYEQLRVRVERTVAALRGRGIAPGDAVLLVAPNSVPAAVAFAALLRCSAVIVALDRRCGAADVAHAISATNARLAVVPEGLTTSLRLAEHAIDVVGLDDVQSGTATDTDWAEPDKSVTRIVLFTSGTTSRPKGVVHSLHSFGAGVRNLATAFGWGEGDAPFLSSPLASITGLSQLHMAVGGNHIVLDDDFEPTRSVALLERYRATVLGGAPVLLEMLFSEYARQGKGSSSLSVVALGGTMIPRAVLEVAVSQFNIKPVRVYGSSEVPTHAATRLDEPIELGMADEGIPLNGGEMAVGSGANQSELMVRGPNMFQGYLDEAHNVDAFERGWFRTGDLAEISDGRLAIRGRIKEVVARKGMKISLAEIDAAVTGLPEAIEWASFGAPDTETGERLVLAIRTVDPESVDYDIVTKFLLGKGVARGKLPEQVDVWREPLPRTPSGKIQRNRLPSPGGDVRTTVAPRLR